ncbi:roundabout homolog 1-like [Hyalella azteca]|uniref:Roundabout homolog 1-like n=1 Tax=Hyalella azteca TaxID=294128 RepID=A0A8B7NLT4_HYAAZ|nr:roundabout homolog 1-like [Hyalella azteca]
MDRAAATLMLRIILLLLCAIITSARITHGPPVITEQPKGGVVRRNDPYTLNCAAQDAKTISWYHNGEPITDLLKDPSSPRILLPSGSLFFLRVATTKKVNDAGTYWCVAQNSAGSVRSDNATIEVAAIDDEFLEIPRPTINVIAGEALTLPCRPPKGTPEPQINWLKNGQVIESDGRVYTSASGELRFLVTKAEDSATYACQASNAAGTKISAPTEITVMDPPSFVIAPKNRTVTTGTILSLPCQVSGFPTPKVDWLRLDGKIPLGRASVSSENSLQLTQVTASDSGIYACVAENEAGMIRAEVHVDVLALPFFKERPNDHVIEVGSTRLLPCIMDGDPPPILMWRLPGEDPTDILLPGHKKGHNRVEEDGRLVMENVKLSESGLYTCMGTNSGGGVSARAKILVVEAFPPPVVGVGPQDQTISNGDHMTLPCEPVSESSEASVSWWFRPAAHLPQHEIVDDPSRGISLSANHALTIRNTNRSNSGIYTCRVTAATGNAEATAVVRFEENELLGHRLEKLLPAPPSKPRVRVLNETSVRLSWQPNSSQIGKKDPVTYMVEYWRHGWSEWQIAASYVNTESTIISDLTPSYTYTFLVRSVTGGGQSFPSPWSNPTRLELLNSNVMTTKNRWQTDRRFDRPTVALLSAKATSSRSVLLTWQGLDNENQENGVLVYCISYETTQGNAEKKPAAVRVATVLGSSSSSHLVKGLDPYTYYTFFLVPFWRNIEGAPTNSLSLTTPEDIPSAAPQQVLLSKRSSSEALVTWEEVDPDHIPGRLLGYAVVVSCNGSVQDHNVTTHWLELKNLVSGCLLTARVAAMTSTGIGPFSAPTLLQLEDQPTYTNDEPAIKQDAMTPNHHMWLIYVLIPLLVLIILGLVLYLRGYVKCQKSPDRHSHSDKCRDHSICSSHCHVNMYGEHHKTWSAIDTPRMQPNACLLRHNHYVNDYAEPNNLVPSDGSQVEAYTTTALMAPTSPHHELPGPGQWTAFLPPPPPSCPPPPLCQYSGSEGTTCSSSHSSSDSYHRGFQNRQPVGVELCSEASCPVYSSGSCGGYKRPCDEASEHTYEAYNQRPSHGAYTETHNLVGCPDSHRTVMHYSPTSSNASSQRGRHVPDNHPPYKPDVPESIPLRKSPVDDSFPTFSSLHAAPKSLHRSDQRL